MGLHNDARKRSNGGVARNGVVDRNDVVTECTKLDADVLVLQEAWWHDGASNDLAEQVAAAVGGELHVYNTPGPLRRAPYRWTVAVISRLKSERIDDTPLISTGGPERVMVRVRLIDHDIVIAGAHLDGIHALQRRPNLLQRQRAEFRRHATENDIVAGDLNMWARVVNRDARPLRNAISGPTWPSWRPHSQIDHILVSDRLEVVDGEVMPDMGSDHRAVRATLRVSPLRSEG